jgi:hypothetical protein
MFAIDPDPQGLPRNVFNKHVDGLLNTGQLNPEILEYCNERQLDILNEIKKALVRISNKHENN